MNKIVTETKSSTAVSSSTSKNTSITWLKKNLFSTWFNSLLTIVSLCFIFWAIRSLTDWALTQAEWTVITANLRIILVGYYPETSIWRIWTALSIVVALTGFSWGTLSKDNLPVRTSLIILAIVTAIFVAISSWAAVRYSILILGMLMLAAIATFLARSLFSSQTWLLLIWVLGFLVIVWLLVGGWLLESVPLNNISGLTLTLLVATVSIVLSLPFGILLALGRQSELPVICWLSTAYIEIFRGLPLIGILFMAQIMLPLVLPSNLFLDRIVRAIAGYTMFTAACLAESVRGGLQSIPRGQTEAAKALGLSFPLVIGLVILPQALRAVIPSIVGQFISLFKDTSLLAVVSLVDLLGISQSIMANPKYAGHSVEIYLFIGLIYWIFCYSMSQVGKKLEEH